MQLIKGTLLQGGKYKIKRCLGQGSFGITYLANMKLTICGGKGKTSTWVDVAIKEFFMKDFNSRKPDGSLNETTSGTIVEKYKKDFKREAENLSKMNHPGVVDILDTFEENNTCYLVMAYIDGESLDAYISKNGALPEKEALECFKQIADALHYMHCQRMLHLDLKPRNIMRDSENKTFVIDFGLSKQYDDNDEPESSTTLGQGTQGYAPLEQGAPHSGHDFPVTIDVYAMGATLYKMLTAQTPPHASVLLSSPEIVKNALTAKGVSKTTMSNILKAMSPRKEDRYKSVASLMKAFGWKVNDYPQEVILAEVVEVPSEDNTIVNVKHEIKKENNKTDCIRTPNKFFSKILASSGIVVLLIVFLFFAIRGCNGWGDKNYDDTDTIPDDIYEDIMLVDTLANEEPPTKRDSEVIKSKGTKNSNEPTRNQDVDKKTQVHPVQNSESPKENHQDPQKSVLKDEQPPKKEPTDVPMEKTKTHNEEKNDKEQVKERKKNIKRELEESVKDAAPKFGLG